MENERNLINEIRKGNTQAFARVVQYYYKDIVLFAASWLRGEQEACEDIVQEVFINIWSAHHELPEMISMKPYLLKAVQNRCMNHLRHFKIKNKYLELSSLSFNEVSKETEEYILFSELHLRLQDALSHLSPIQRQCFEMNRIEGMKQVQVAEKLGMPLRTVEKRIAEALKILKFHLKEYYLLVCYYYFADFF